MRLNAKPNSLKTVNQDSFPAYKMNDKLELVTRAATSFWKEPKFYGEADEQAKEFIELAERVAKQDTEFVFKLAVYCRNVLKLRTVSVVLFVIASNYSNPINKVLENPGKVKLTKKEAAQTGLARKYAERVIVRADEVMEAVAFQIEHKGSKAKFPKNLQRGLADVLLSFDEYELAKYDRPGSVKLRDAIILLHPKPKTKVKAALLKRALEGQLKTPKTWEVEISTKGSTKANWEKIMPELHYMALLRNCRNFLEKGVKMRHVLARISNPEEVAKSKQLPFRFLSAYRELQEVSSPDTNDALEAVASAFDASMVNVAELKGTTVVLVDHSGSMEGAVSEKSKVSRFDAACALAAIVNAKSKKSNVLCFSEDFKVVNLRKGAGIDVIQLLKTCMPFGGTNTGRVMQFLVDSKLKADRVILLTDEQQNEGDPVGQVWSEYRNKVNPEAVLYSVDLAGYGTSSFAPGNGVVKLAGFTERLLDLVRTNENGGFEKLVQTIEGGKF